MEKAKFNFSNIDLLSYNPVLAEEKTHTGKDYVSWGIYNNYPQYLYDTYCNCSTLQSIINGSIDFTIGNRIINNTPLKGKNADGDTIEKVVKKVATDLWIFGGTNIQIIPNRAKQINEVVWLDTRHCRTNEDNSNVFYSKNWCGSGRRNVIKYDRFNRDDLTTSQVYYYKGEKSRGVYPVPDYKASLVSAETQIEIKKFHYNTIINNFVVNGILNFNNASDVQDEVKIDIERKIKSKFTGAENSGNLMISWNEDKTKAVTFERITDDQFDEKYQTLSEDTKEDLFISLRALPVLFGMTVQTGFNTQEYEEAFKLYNRTAIVPKQNALKEIFNEIFNMENAIDFEPFQL